MTAPSMADAAVVELRQYTLRPGRRDDLVDVFEAELIEGQQAEGMRIGGVFLDRDDPCRFVWLRGFASMASRRRGLEAFYTGPVWKAHGGRANATMVDSDDVLLLRPTDPPHPPADPPAAVDRSGEWVVAEVYQYAADDRTERRLSTDLHAELEAELGVPVAAWRTEPAVNDFPALPVRDVHALVWLAVFTGRESYDEVRARLDRIARRLESIVTSRQHLDLQPTARSAHPPAAPCGVRGWA
jgi:NIPSNAP